MMAELRDQHKTEHVSVLDVLKDLPYIRQAIFSDESLSEGEKIHWWSFVLVSLDHGCRVSENTIFCVNLDQVGTPGQISGREVPFAYDSEEWPKWREIRCVCVCVCVCVRVCV